MPREQRPNAVPPRSSTTLSDPQLSKPLFRPIHPVQVSRAADQEQAGEDLLNERAHLGKREPWAGAGTAAFALEKRIGHGTDHHVMVPPRIRAALEMIEAEFGFEILIVLFDRPALMGQPDDLGQRRGRGQRDEVVLATPGRAQAPFAQEPNFRGEASLPPIGRRRDAAGGKVGFPGRIRSVAPRHAVPRPCQQRVAEAADAERLLIGPAAGAIARRRLRAIDAQGGRAAEDRQRRRNAQRIGQAQPMQHLADRPVVAVFGVGHHRGQGQAGRSRAAHQRQGEPPLLLKDDGHGNPRRGAADGVARPRLGQIEQGTHRPRALSRPQRGGDRDLAIRHFAQRAAVLARRPDRMGTRLGKARLVEDQNAGALGDLRSQPAPHDLGLPRRVRDEVLEGLIRGRLADAREHRRHRLARAVAQQPVDVLAQRRVLRAMTEAVLELIQPSRQASQQRPRMPIEHRRAAYRNSTERTMSSISITHGFPRESNDLTKSY